MHLRRRSIVVTSVPPRRRRLLVTAALVTAALVVAGGVAGAAAVALHPGGTAPVAADAVTPFHVDTSGFPKGDVGIFTDTCRRTTTVANDPILMPRMAGMSMRHDFFGNTGTTASSTPAQLVGGSSSCSTSADASAYWTPVLFQNGTAVTPKAALIYWRAPAATSRSVKTIPAGLTMIAGNEDATAPQDPRITGWRCSGRQGGRATAVPHACSSGSMLRLTITFPNCWDGRTLSGKAQKNVVYTATPKAACPASHPVQIPQIVFHANYPTSSTSGLTLSIGPTQTGSVDTEHADFMNGWNERTLTSDVAACTAAQVRCGPVRGADAVPRGGRTPAQRRQHRMQGGMRQHRKDGATAS